MTLVLVSRQMQMDSQSKLTFGSLTTSSGSLRLLQNRQPILENWSIAKSSFTPGLLLWHSRLVYWWHDGGLCLSVSYVNCWVRSCLSGWAYRMSCKETQGNRINKAGTSWARLQKSIGRLQSWMRQRLRRMLRLYKVYRHSRLWGWFIFIIIIIIILVAKKILEFSIILVDLCSSSEFPPNSRHTRNSSWTSNPLDHRCCRPSWRVLSPLRSIRIFVEEKDTSIDV